MGKGKTWRNFENFIENVVSFQDKFEIFNKNSEGNQQKFKFFLISRLISGLVLFYSLQISPGMVGRRSSAPFPLVGPLLD